MWKLVALHSLTLELELPSSIAEISAVLPYLEYALCSLPRTLHTLSLELVVPPALSAASLNTSVVKSSMWSQVAVAIANSEVSNLTITADGFAWSPTQVRRFRRVFRHSTGRTIRRHVYTPLMIWPTDAGMRLQL